MIIASHLRLFRHPFWIEPLSKKLWQHEGFRFVTGSKKAFCVFQVDNLQLVEEDSGQIVHSSTSDVTAEQGASVQEQHVEMSSSASQPTPEEDASSALQALQYAGAYSAKSILYIHSS